MDCAIYLFVLSLHVETGLAGFLPVGGETRFFLWKNLGGKNCFACKNKILQHKL